MRTPVPVPSPLRPTRASASPRRRWTTAALTAAMLVAVSGPGQASLPADALATSAEADAPHLVTMGAIDPALPDTSPRPPATEGRTDRFEYMAYYPDHLRVHRGDTVLFRRDGFHTVTFSPEGEARGGFVRRDEVEGAAAENFTQQPSDPGCGTPAAPCRLSDTDQYVNSGWHDLSLSVDLPVGAYTYYCMLHEGMEGSVEVVPDDEPLPSADAIEAERRAQVAVDTEAAEALMDANQTPEAHPEGDHLRWVVKAGDTTDDDRVAVLRFMPGNLEIGTGDEVDFVVSGGDRLPPGRSEFAAELHTVTFPNEAVLAPFGLLRYLVPACDPDDPRSGAPGVPGLYPAVVTGCAPGTTFELLLQPAAWQAPTRAPGDAVATPFTVHDSGLLTRSDVACRSTCDPWTGEPFPTSSRAVFPLEGTFSYVCLVHPEMGMAGSITVAGD